MSVMSITHTSETILVASVPVTLVVVTSPRWPDSAVAEARGTDGRRVVMVGAGAHDSVVSAAMNRVAFSRAGQPKRCHGCGTGVRQGIEGALDGTYAVVWADSEGGWVCPETGDEHDPEHTYAYRADLSSPWCEECDTATDYCDQINPR